MTKERSKVGVTVTFLGRNVAKPHTLGFGGISWKKNKNGCVLWANHRDIHGKKRHFLVIATAHDYETSPVTCRISVKPSLMYAADEGLSCTLVRMHSFLHLFFGCCFKTHCTYCFLALFFLFCFTVLNSTISTNQDMSGTQNRFSIWHKPTLDSGSVILVKIDSARIDFSLQIRQKRPSSINTCKILYPHITSPSATRQMRRDGRFCSDIFPRLRRSLTTARFQLGIFYPAQPVQGAISSLECSNEISVTVHTDLCFSIVHKTFLIVRFPLVTKSKSEPKSSSRASTNDCRIPWLYRLLFLSSLQDRIR